MLDPHLAEREMGLNTREALAHAKQARLARETDSLRESTSWRQLMTRAIQSLKTLWAQQHTAHGKESATWSETPSQSG